VLPAGQVCPTPKHYGNGPAAKNVTLVPEEKWTDGMRNVAGYARFLAEELMGVKLAVSVVHTANNFVACYGGGRLDFNLIRLGHNWFDKGVREDVDELLLHEFGHQFSGDHLSDEYHAALCRLSARLKRLALEKPDAIRSFVKEQAPGCRNR
jgi:hypothetical protein